MRITLLLAKNLLIGAFIGMVSMHSLAQSANAQNTGTRVVNNSSGQELELNTIVGNNGEEIGREFMTGKEVVLDKDGHFIKGGGEIAMYTGKGFWHPVILVTNASTGKSIQIKAGVGIITWDESGATTRISGLAPILECDNGRTINITSPLDEPTVKGGLLLLDTDLGQLALKITFGATGEVVGPAAFLFVTDEAQLQSLREGVKAARVAAAKAAPAEHLSPRWIAEAGKGKLVAFDTGDDLWVMQSDGSTGPKRLTDGTKGISDPAWSPDGTRLAYLANNDLHRYGGNMIWCVNSDGTGSHQVASSTFQLLELAWSSDGKHLAYVNAAKAFDPDQIHVVDADGSNDNQLTSDEADKFDPFWSPNGALIAYVCRPKGANNGGQVYVMNSDGTSQRHVSNSQADDSLLGWAKDGKSVVFLSQGVDGGTALYTADVSGTNVAPVAHPLNRTDRIAFAKLSASGDILFIAIKDEVLDPCVMKADGSDQRKIIEDSHPNGPYSISSDGQFIVFECRRSGYRGLCVVGLDGQDFHQLNPKGSHPAWQP